MKERGIEENTLVMYEVLKSGGLTTGGDFDARVRTLSIDAEDLFHGNIRKRY